MANNTDEIRSTLNNLIETLKDGEEGLRASAEKLKERNMRSQFESFAQQRARFAAELQSRVSRIGGKPETSGSTAGALHRGWMDIKNAIAGNDDYGILVEAERGEDGAVKNYRDTLSKDLPSDIRSVIDSQYREILSAHNTIKSLRDRESTTSTATGTPRAY
jgi:uncharacterized protein (TIGR02284 family)